MPSKITYGHNIDALRAKRLLDQSSNRLSRTFEQLSSGQRINRASDDAAGLAVSSRLRTDSRVFGQAIRNLNDGVSLLNTAEGTLRSLTDITIRLKELTTQAANGSYSLSQRQALNTEASRLTDEFNRLVSTTRFNGMNILDASRTSLGFQGGYGNTGQILVGLARELSRTVGNGTVGTQTGVALPGSTPQSMVTGDFNRDGKLDIAAVEGSQVVVFGGDGKGGTTGEDTYTVGTGPLDIASGDFNGDGIVDLVAANNGSGNISVLLGNQSGGFNSAVNYTVGTNPRSLGVSDFNGDGILDLAVGNYSSASISILLGTGSGTFSSGVSVSVGTQPTSVTVGDFNADGISDLASANNGSGTVSVLLGNGKGGFSASSTISGLALVQGVRAGDFNGDGRDDLAVGIFGATSLSIVLASGNGTFGAATTYSYGGGSYSGGHGPLALTDLNGDGHLDLVAGTDSTVSFFTGTGLGTFNAAVTINSSDNFGITTGDLNNDGGVDIITASDGSASIETFLSNTQTISTIGRININTAPKARATLPQLDAILTRISNELGSIGASQSRLGHALGVLGTTRDNIKAAESRIRDADVAQNTASLAREQIVQQTGVAILAQANQQPLIALGLLQDL